MSLGNKNLPHYLFNASTLHVFWQDKRASRRSSKLNTYVLEWESIWLLDKYGQNLNNNKQTLVLPNSRGALRWPSYVLSKEICGCYIVRLATNKKAYISTEVCTNISAHFSHTVLSIQIIMYLMYQYLCPFHSHTIHTDNMYLTYQHLCPLSIERYVPHVSTSLPIIHTEICTSCINISAHFSAGRSAKKGKHLGGSTSLSGIFNNFKSVAGYLDTYRIGTPL